MEIEVESNKVEGGGDTSPGCSGYANMVHSKKVIKHALRQQAKRRRKNTTIASGNSRTLPRIVVKPLAPPPPNDPPSPPVPSVQLVNAVEEPAATMREVLASLPGFSLKSGRRRSTKRLSAAAQLEAGLVDLETPASILASTSLRALLNRHTFQGLPPLYQRKLAQLLPAVDRQDAATSGLNNEFFSRACLEWRKRLAEGEFTPENQQRLKMEAERDKNKLDPWKLKHFEPIWGDKREPKLRLGLHCIPEPRTGGAVTRSSLRLRLESNTDQISSDLYCRSSSNATEMKIATESEEVTETNEVPVKSMENGPDETRVEALPEYDDVPEIPPATENRLASNETEKVVEETTNEDNKTVEYSTEEQQPPDESTTDSREPEVFIEMKEPDIQPEESMQIEETPTEIPTENVQSPEETMEILETSVTEETNDLIKSQMTPVTDIQCTTDLNPTDPTDVIPVALAHVEDDAAQVLQVVSEEHHLQQEPSHHHHHSLLEAEKSKIFEISECENAAAVESISGHEEAETSDQLSEEHPVITAQIVDSQHTETINPSGTETEPQIPECMEIDSETLQRIHELEVRGEMREAYEEISGCPEEIIYPILGSMEMGTRVAPEETENQTVVVAETVVVSEDGNEQPDVMNVVNVDDELRDANNYVCSEMLECSWPVDATVNTGVNNNNSNINSSPAQEDLQVPWPLVAAALDGTVAANITVTTQDDCNDATSNNDATMSTTPSNQSQAAQQQTHFVTNETNPESISCIQLPVVQGVSSFQPAETTMTINATSAPVAVSLMKTVQSNSPPIIAFPSLQSIRFVQTRFHHGQQQNTGQANLSGTNALTPQITSQHNPTAHQVNIVRPNDDIAQLANVPNSQQQQQQQPQQQHQQQQHQNNNVVARNNLTNNITVRNSVQANVVQATVGLPNQIHQPSAIVVQHQTPMVTGPSRQIVASMQPQQYSTNVVPTRNSRGTGQGSYRASRNSNKEQGGGRSRSSTKEPPGAVNLERSYQICQAVIQSSPNRDQLKAHLKPPPSLLARGDGAFTTSKTGGRTITTVKTQKQTSQHGKQTQNKAQAVMLRQVFATARQAAPVEVAENNAVAQLSTNGTGGFGQYILVQRTGVSDGAPRASSAPPLPPQIAGIGVGVHLVRGRPASAGEGSHQAVTLKARGTTDGRGGGGAEPGAPGVIMGGDPPPPCECNMRGAMVICRQCGAFCHDDCIGPQRICATCLIR
ncbi:polycomb protein Asx isoform X2 [Venturia canescens]|uniref:polycomb protein Asx isoform X2 n=1 Tax=Venturia canescens TaxID=32260 RepID=UPI001C9CAB3A|nr:polycomb protein Asx isoform X2 [Venturia canescens]